MPFQLFHTDSLNFVPCLQFVPKLDFAKNAFNGQTPLSGKEIKGDSGAWVAQLPDGSQVIYRPGGQASSSTDPTTANVDINNNTAVQGINNGNNAKFKFPKL